MKNGFTLVELSIVLVIIGLLIGGILIAQSLVRSAEINAQIRQFEQYDIALNNFKSKFRCIPGDCPIDFGSKPGVGNGDGWIQGNSSPGFGNSLTLEVVSYFADLYDSGMINEEYSVIGNHFVRGVGTPFGKIGNGGIIITSDSNKDIEYFYGMNRDITGGSPPPYFWFANEPVLSVVDALSVDTKIDDGLPSLGDVVASLGETSNGANNYRPEDGFDLLLDTTNGVCINTGSPNTYNATNNDDKACSLRVKAKEY